MRAKNDYSKFRWTLDNKDDFKLIKILYKNLYRKNKNFYMNDIIKYFNKNPKVAYLNKKYIGKEKYKNI